MMGFLLASTFDDFIISSISQIASGMGANAITLGAIALLFVLILITSIRIVRSYENRLLKSIKKTNAFFSKNPYVNNDNLVELNSRMKEMPKTVRFCWQEYMLNRDKMPSEYINQQTCLDKADKAGGFGGAVQVCGTFTGIIAMLTAICFLVFYVGGSSSAELFLVRAITVPLLLLAVGYFAVAIMQFRHSQVTGELHYEFNEFVRYLNKACSTMPPFVDYEVLFTQKEIKEGIPVLQDYLEKKAYEEQKQAEEKAQQDENFDKFDFNELGVENAILLDRAMLECEKYFNTKRVLTEKLNSKQQEEYNFSKNFDEVTKDFERKAQTHRENMASLNEQLNTAATQIDANYIKKQYNDEQKKLQQLEKDYDLAQSRFKKQQDEFEVEIKAISDEITSKKSNIEDVMKLEGKTYANKVYGIINSMIAAQNEPFFRQVEEEKQNLQAQVNTLSQTIANQQNEINTKNVQISELDKDLKLRLAQIEAIGNVKDYFASKEFRDRVRDSKKIEPMEEVPDAFKGEGVEELKQKLFDAENRLKEANAKQIEMQNQEAELMNKIRAYENGEVKTKTNQQIVETAPNESLQELQNTIEAENQNYLDTQNQLNNTVDETLNALNNETPNFNNAKNKEPENTNKTKDKKKGVFNMFKKK